MSESLSLPTLPPIRRIVTANDSEGRGIIQSEVQLSSKPMAIVPGGRNIPLWVTADGIPTKDCNNDDDGSRRIINPTDNFGLCPATGTNLQFTELAPQAITPMHRTSSLDYNILIEGEVVLMMDDGTEKHLNRPGDTVVQRGTMHAWRNPSKDRWARYVSVLMAAEPAVVQGNKLEPSVLPL